MTDLAWSPDALFTKEHAEYFINKGACDDIIDFVGLPLGECAENWPSFALRYAADRLTPALLEWCAEMDPWHALSYAADRLSPEMAKWCEEACRCN